MPPVTGDVQSTLQSLVTGLINLQTTGGGHSPKRYYSLLFRDLPNKKQYADYYKVINEPRALNGVMDTLKKGNYSSPEAFAYDLFLIWANAKDYNEQGSQVYNDAIKLENHMEKLWTERLNLLPPFKTLSKPARLIDNSLEPPAEANDIGHTAKKIKLTSSSLKSSSKDLGNTASATPPSHKIKLGGGLASAAPPSANVSTPTTRIRLVNAPSNPPITLKLGGLNKSPLVVTPVVDTHTSEAETNMKVKSPQPASPPVSQPLIVQQPTRSTDVAVTLIPNDEQMPTSDTLTSVKSEADQSHQIIPPETETVIEATTEQDSSSHPEGQKLVSESSAQEDAQESNPIIADVVAQVDTKESNGYGDFSPEPNHSPQPQVIGNGIYFQTPHGTLLGPNGLPLKKETRKDRRAREKEEKLRLRAEAQAAAIAGTTWPKPEQSKGDGQSNTGPKFDGIPDVDPGWMGGEIPDDAIPMYIDIVHKLRDHTDATGRQLATPILTLPDRAARPDYYAVVANPLALDIIEERASSGSYETPEQFDRDLHQLFQNSRIFIKHDTPGNVYSDLVVLQRLYQELTKRRSHLSPPKSLALSSLSSVAAGPGNILQTKRAESPNAGEDADNMKSVSNSRITLKDKIFLDGINFKGDILRVGDWVHLLNPDNPGKPIIAQIFKVYKRIDSPQRCISVCWYYRPEETVHPASRQFYENEVFKTSNFVDHAVEDYIDRCFVMFFTRYIRGRPRPPAFRPPMILYVCEHRYKDDVKSFKKIKNWNSCVPEEIRKNEYDFVPYQNDRIDALARIKSPFVRGLRGPGGIGDALEKEEEDQAKYHFLPGGEPASAHRLKTTRDQSGQVQESPPPEDIASPAMALYGNGVPLSAPPLAPSPIISRPKKQPPTTVLPQIGSGLSPAEMAVGSETFAPLPDKIKSKFRGDGTNDLFWFAAPATSIPRHSRPSHSLDYLYWVARNSKSNIEDFVGLNGGDVEMRNIL